MKGQFMMLSALVIGLIMIGAAATVSEASRTSLEPDLDASYVYMAKDEAREYDMSDPGDRASLLRMANSAGGFDSSIKGSGPYNLTLRNGETYFTLVLAD